MVILKEHDLGFLLSGERSEVQTDIGGEAGIKAGEYLARIRKESNNGNFTIFLVGNIEQDLVCHFLVGLLGQGGPFSLVFVSPQKPNEMTDFQKCLWGLQLPVTVFAANSLPTAIQWETKRKEDVLKHIEKAKERKHRLFLEHLKDPEEEEGFQPPVLPVFFYFAEIQPDCSEPERFVLTPELKEKIEQTGSSQRPVFILKERSVPNSISP